MVQKSLNGLGLYLHVPFCARKCSYCDFPSWGGQLQHREKYVDRLLAEMVQRGAAAAHRQVDSVYIGGGTPSLLTPAQLARVLSGIKAAFSLSADCEISCEANPGTLSDAWLEAAGQGGVNRLSLGAQGAQEGLLRLLGRTHTWAQVVQAVQRARAHGFDNVNIDLMMGIPTQETAQWVSTLEAALALHPEHLSCYGLIPEEGTPLGLRIQSGELALPDEDAERAMYEHTLSALKQAGYIHYEISNFSQPGRACRHNVHCWQRRDYLGLGAAAHSLLDNRRLVNPQTLMGYLAGEAPQSQDISPEDRMFESLMLALRMTCGLDLVAFEETYGESFSAVYGSKAQASLEEGLTQLTPEGFFRLTRRGMDVMNTVLLDFLP